MCLGKLEAIYANTFSKVSVLISAKTKQNIFIHTSVFVSFSPIHTKTLENDENDLDLCKVERPRSIHGQMVRFGLEPKTFDAFHVTVLKSLRFHLSTTKNEAFSSLYFWNRFQKTSFLWSFSGVLAWMKSENA